MRKAEALNQLRTTRDQIRKVTVLIQEEAHCVDILHRIVAIQQTLDKFKWELRHTHFEACVTQALREKNHHDRQRIIRDLLDILFP